MTKWDVFLKHSVHIHFASPKTTMITLRNATIFRNSCDKITRGQQVTGRISAYLSST